MTEVLRPSGFVPLDFNLDRLTLWCPGEKHVVRNVVKNTVVNMEHVLGDLNGIMGDIQSLVAQIDSVTARIDRRCSREEARSRRRQGEARPSYPERPLIHSDGRCTEDTSWHQGNVPADQEAQRKDSHIRHPLGSSRSSQPVAQASVAPMVSSASSQAYPKDKTTRDNDIISNSSVKEWFFKKSTRHSMPVDIHQSDSVACGDYNLKTQKARIQIFESEGSPTRFQHIPNVGSQTAGIAIVHPTVFSSPQLPSFVGFDGAEKTHLSDENIKQQAFVTQKCTVTQCSKDSDGSPELFRKDTCASQDLLCKDANMSKKLQVYNAYYQPITPTEQASAKESKTTTKVPVRSPSQRRWSNNEIIPPSPFRLRRSCMGSLPNSPRHQRTLERARLNPHFSPSLGRPLAKHVYSKIDGSLSSSTSSGLVCKSVAQNYYYSIDSDLDSDLVVSYSADGRSVTPDIDWSYLSLVGGDGINSHCDFVAEKLACIDNEDYEVPVLPNFASGKPFEILQTSPDVVTRVPIFQIMQQKPHGSPTGVVEKPRVGDEKLYERPVVSHVFCDEVVSDMSTGYCGCYEALLDAVLENVAGYETFEEAVLNFDNDEIVTETYINFDDDFEWDVGLSPEEQYDFELNSPLVCVQECSDSEFGEDLFSFLQSDDESDGPECSLISGSSSQLLNRPQDLAIKQRKDSGYVENKPTSVDAPESTSCNKRKLSPQTSIHEDKVALGATGHSNYYQIKEWQRKQPSRIPLYLQMSPIYSSNNTPCTESSEDHDLANPMTLSSDDTSCQAVCTGSPMSLSSTEAPFTSPETDRLISSSEADDLFTSHDENYFLSPGSAPRTPGEAPRKTNARLLRQEFFKTLCKVCDENDGESNKTDLRNTGSFEETNNFHGQSKTEGVSDTGSLNGDGTTSYNRNVNTWTAYALVNVQADDISDSASDFINDNGLISSMTSSYIDADNLSSAPESQSVLW